MRRFLVYLGYSGTRLRGVQKQVGEGEVSEVSSVHGHLEAGLLHLRPANVPVVYFSSRTDAGVHALGNTAHIDLERSNPQYPYEPEYITFGLNRYFQKSKLHIRVHKTLHVPETFHARFCAKGRTYLYRLAAIKPETFTSHSDTRSIDALLPIQELDKVYLVRSPIDVEKVREACRLLEGDHDFASFCHRPTTSTVTCRTLQKIEISEGRPLLNPEYDPLSHNLQFWDVTFHSQSFLWKQIRRTVGVLVAVGQGHIGLDDVRHMLAVPSKDSWPSRAITAPPGGLYLTAVHYPPEVLCPPEEVTTEQFQE